MCPPLSHAPCRDVVLVTLPSPIGSGAARIAQGLIGRVGEIQPGVPISGKDQRAEPRQLPSYPTDS